MKSYEFDAVVFDGDVFCVGCLPPDVNEDDEDVSPIFADSEWEHPGAPCNVCNDIHAYMNLTDEPGDVFEEDEATIDDEDPATE